jgi:hypothetical protein
MDLKLSQKQILCILALGFLLTLGSGTLTFIFCKPYDLYIRLTDITWPPPPGTILQSDIDAVYGVPMTIEIWNPSNETLYHTTPNMNLVDPQMEITLEEDYPVWADYTFVILFTNHTIEPGITELRGIIDIVVQNYNASIPPAGKYVVWSGIDGYHQFDVISYKTTIFHEITDYEISFECTPTSWGKINPFYRKLTPIILWALSGGEIAAIGHIYLRNRKKRKLIT